MRIISAAPSNTEILYALGLGESVVAVTRFCDYPEDAKTKPNIGGWIDVNYEKLKSFNPDLVIASSFVQNKIVTELKKQGIKVLQVDPLSINDVYESIRRIGEVTGTAIQAEKLIQDMQNGFLAIQTERGMLQQRFKVYAEEWHQPPTCAGNWVPELIELAGGNSFCPQGIVSEPFDENKLFAWNPKIVILHWCGFGTQSNIDWFKQRWPTLDAVKNNKVYCIDDRLLNRPGPRLVEATREIQKVLGVMQVNSPA